MRLGVSNKIDVPSREESERVIVTDSAAFFSLNPNPQTLPNAPFEASFRNESPIFPVYAP